MNAKQFNQRQLNSALHAAVDGCNQTGHIENHISCIQHLVDAGAQINGEKKNKTILMIAASKGFIELVADILAREAWVNHGDSESRTALHYAIDIKAENLDVVKLLMDKEADFNKETTSEGWSPLIIAVNRGHINIAKALVEAGANLEAVEWQAQNTALHAACLKGEKEIVELLATDATYELICQKANKTGQTPKMLAEERVMLLSEKGQSKELMDAYEILDHLDNLQTRQEERAKKAGDNLISEEIDKDDRRMKRAEKQMQQAREQKERESKEREQRKQEAILMESQEQANAKSKLNESERQN